MVDTTGSNAPSCGTSSDSNEDPGTNSGKEATESKVSLPQQSPSSTQGDSSNLLSTTLREESMTSISHSAEEAATTTTLDSSPPRPLGEVFIAVMGQTGTGKSTFINQVTGTKSLQVGSALDSCTQNIQFATTTLNGLRVTLIDTPGFDETGKDDAQILTLIGVWLNHAHANKQLLSGVIYLHRIMDPRMTGASVRSLTLMKKMCGTKTYENIALATTMWDLVDLELAEQREKQLKGNWWAHIINGGGRVFRHDSKGNSAKKIVTELLPNPSLPLLIQEELVRVGVIGKTDAGIYAEGYLETLQQKKNGEIDAMRKSIEALQNEKKENEATEKKLREDLEKAVETIKQLKEDRARLNMRVRDLEVTARAEGTETQQTFLTKVWAMIARWDDGK